MYKEGRFHEKEEFKRKACDGVCACFFSGADVYKRQVVEKEDKIQVQRFAGQWKDLGTWNTLTEAMEESVVGNGVLNETCSDVLSLIHIFLC